MRHSSFFRVFLPVLLFSLLGFLGMYAVLSILWIVLVSNFIQDGPQAVSQDGPAHSSKTA